MQSQPTISSLATELTSQASDLFRNELRLARAEAVESLKAMGVAAAFAAAALALAAAALTLALVAGAYLLDEMMPFWLAALVMAILGAIGAYLLVSTARKKLSSEPMQLKRTTRQLSRDISLIKESLPHER